MTWTLDELAALAARALADADVRVANGRVTGAPDARMVRWYATKGLVDRPLTGPGRSARYGMRHLLQLVAVKRLQAEGYPLVQIQARLAGATDATLRAIAALPAGLAIDPALPIDPADAAVPAGPARLEVREAGSDAAPPLRFWAARSVAAPPQAQPQPQPSAQPEVKVGTVDCFWVEVGGLTVLLSVRPGADDLHAIAAAARPLLDELAARGLLTTEGATS